MSESKVLIVEDDPAVLVLATQALRDAGLFVVQAESVDLAYDILEMSNKDISVVFSDMETPGLLDGLHLSYVVARRWPDIQVILTSGQSISGVNSAPVAKFFSKPYDINSMAAFVGDLCGREPH